jgi:hypothetical protein
MGTVVIGIDPHKRSATIEVMAADERVLGGGRNGTDAAGYAAMLAGPSARRRSASRAGVIGRPGSRSVVSTGMSAPATAATPPSSSTSRSGVRQRRCRTTLVVRHR